MEGMQVKKIPNNRKDDFTVCITRTAKDRETGERKSKVMRTLGKLSELKAIHGEKLDEFIRKEKEDCEAEFKKASQDYAIRITPGKIINLRKSGAPESVDNVRNIGCYVLLKQYKRLGIDTFFNNRSRGIKSKYKYNPIFRLLVVDRVIAPGSKLHTHDNCERYFFNTDFPLEAVYRALKPISELKEPLLKAMNKRIEEIYKRDTSLLYYDVTNYYFEIDDEDGKKRCGCSKEHRKTPIIQMGLFMDSQGFPVSYSTFPGNCNDVSTFIPAMQDMKEKFSMEHTVYVADKGMMSADNIADIVLQHNGYIISDSVRKVSDDFFTDYVLNEEGYECTEDVLNGRTAFKCKELTLPQKKKVSKDEGGKASFTFNERIIIFWSSKYAEKARYDRMKAIEKAKESMKNPGSKVNNNYGSYKYIKATAFSKSSGLEDSDKKEYSLEIDWDKVEEESKYDGYYLIRSNVYGLEEGEPPMDKPSKFEGRTLSVKLNRKVDMYDIVDMYRGLWKIEETFKMSKTDGIQTRPVYLKREERIEAHFLTCFTAMMLIRMIEKDTGLCYEQIISSLQKANYTKAGPDVYRFQYYDKTMDIITKKTGVPLNYENITPVEIKQLAGS